MQHVHGVGKLHDVVSLFINIPIDKSLEVICSGLENNNEPKEKKITNKKNKKKQKKKKQQQQKTKSLASDIIELLKVVLTTSYFSFRGKIYQQ